MYRIDDWHCDACGERTEHFTERGGEKIQLLRCGHCGVDRMMSRAPSAPAEYLKEKIRAHHTPRIKGGRHDTEGFQQGPPVPDLPGAEEADLKYQRAMAELPPDVDPREKLAVANELAKDAPSIADYHEDSKRPEVRDALAETKAINAANKLKRKRAASGVSIADAPLPCDSKETHS